MLTSPVHLPIRMFWYKVKRFLSGTFYDYEDQIKMAARFDPTNDDYPKYIEKLIYTIDQTDDDKKIDWFASLTRAFLLELIDESLFWKLTQYLKLCTSDELEFVKACPDEYAGPLNVMVSALYYYGLFDQYTDQNNKAIYKLSSMAKALKMNYLNFDRELHGVQRITGYADLNPIGIQEPYTFDDIEKMAEGHEIILDGGKA